jgi:tetrahydromethanopterin S-methyltransferase subunit F
MNRLMALGAGLIAGCVVGVAGGFVFADRVALGTVMVPYGLVLAPLTFLLVQLWLGRNYQTRIAPFGAAVGWLAATVMLGSSSSGGDVALPGSTHATVYVFGTAVLAAAAVTMPVLQTRARYYPQDITSD